ncbi:MAG: hypothetical protein RLZZ153_189 [Pseudomonadota bacterium]|jgi:uncharacterized RmlC-like cupin family protein
MKAQRPVVTAAEMKKRVAVFKKLKSSSMPLIDAVMPQYNRDIFNIIGRGVTEDASMEVAINDARDFHVAIIRCEAGKGTGLHTHETLEVFMPLTGNWSVQWGDDGKSELSIGPWDFISIPTKIMRGFRNDSPGEAYMLSILGGTDPGRVTWCDPVMRAAERAGYVLDAEGNITHKSAAPSASRGGAAGASKAAARAKPAAGKPAARAKTGSGKGAAQAKPAAKKAAAGQRGASQAPAVKRAATKKPAASAASHGAKQRTAKSGRSARA